MISFQKRKFGLVRRYSIVGGRRLSNYWWSVVLFLGGCGFLLTGISSYFNRNLLLVMPKIEQVISLRQNVATLSIDPYPQTLVGSWGLVAKYKKELAMATIPTSLIPPTPSSTNFALSRGVRNISKEIPANSYEYRGLSSQAYSGVNGDALLISKGLEVVNGVPSLSFFPQGLVLSFYGFLGLCFSFHLCFTLAWQIGAGFNEFNGKEKYVRIFRWGRPGKNRRIDYKYTNELIETIKIELVPKPALFLCIKGDKKIPLTRIGEFIPLEDLENQAAELISLLQVPLEIENVR